ncbi:MAG: hypothetical protein WA821_11715 [Anaerolineales bacterium]
MLNSIVLPDGIESAIQGVLWTVLAIFFVMVILSWLVASKEWEEEEPAATENPEPQSDEPENIQEA